MLWSEFKSRVTSRLQDTGLSAKVYEWYNDVIAEVDAKTRWRHLEERATLVTVAPYTTGTVSITNGTTTVTGSGTVFPSGSADQLFVGPDDNVYLISSRDSDTQLTLSSAYIGTTVSGGSFKVCSNKLTLPSDFRPPRFVGLALQSGAGPHSRVPFLDMDDTLNAVPNQTWTSAQPTRFRFYRGNLMLYPVPDDVYNVDLYYLKKPTQFTSTTDDSTDLDTEWPDGLQLAILSGVLEIGAQYIHDYDLADRMGTKFRFRLGQESTEDGEFPGQDQVLKRDDQTSAGLGSGTLPRHLTTL